MAIKKKSEGSNATGGVVESLKPTNSIDLLHKRLGELTEASQVIQNVCDEEKRELNPEEMKTLEENGREFDKLEAEILARSRTSDMEARRRALEEPQQRRTNDDEPVDDGEVVAKEARRPYASSVHGGMPVGTRKTSLGFRSFGEWAIAAKQTKNGKPDLRIMNAPSTFGQEGLNSDGGFAVPPDFRQQIMKQIMGEESLLSLTDQQVTSSNSLILPLDTSTPWQTSGGVLPAWTGEGGTITGSKPSLGQLETKLNKLAAIVPITDELMQDVPALTQWLSTKVPEKFTSFINDAIINGSGVARPQGMLNAACKITQAAESGQGAGTVVAKNLANMWSRLYGPLRQKAYWLINQDVEPALQVMVMPGTTPAYPVYLQPGGFSERPYATIYGRPVLPLEACATVGTEGDIILCIPSQYLSVIKTDGMRTDVSIHLYFDSDHTAFRFVMRIGGQSYWPAAVARAHGSNTLSTIVTLNSTRT
jgi:HK97 family phage major capsid protein